MSSDILDAWKGRIAEHIVGQELLCLTDKVSAKRSFWVRSETNATAEVDFTYLYNSNIIPIEVKNGNNTHLRSLHSYIDRSEVKTAIRIWSAPYQVDTVKTNAGNTFKLLSLPFYMVSQIERLLDEEYI